VICETKPALYPNKELYSALMIKRAKKNYEEAYIRYVTYQRDVNRALALLQLHVSSSIRSVLMDYTDPCAAFKYLQERYGPGSVQTDLTLLVAVGGLQLKDCKDLSGFFSKLEDIVIRLQDLGHHFDDSALQDKVLQSLPSEFNETILFMYLLNNLYEQEWHVFDKLKRQLLEARLGINKTEKIMEEHSNEDDSKESKDGQDLAGHFLQLL
jgi:signal recognition particle GTPase